MAQKRALCGVKFFAATCSFLLFATKIFKTISGKEMEPSFVRMKIPELKKYLQVRGIFEWRKPP